MNRTASVKSRTRVFTFYVHINNDNSFVLNDYSHANIFEKPKLIPSLLFSYRQSNDQENTGQLFGRGVHDVWHGQAQSEDIEHVVHEWNGRPAVEEEQNSNVGIFRYE
jgi:hypothetical protein